MSLIPELVLLVEDSPTQAGMIRATLERAGYSVETADSLARARNSLGLGSKALVLLDLHLPDGDGREFAEQMRGDPDLSSTPIIYLSGDFDDIKDDLSTKGIDDYLIKPPEADQLVARVGLTLRLRRIQAGLDRSGMLDPPTGLLNLPGTLFSLEDESARATRSGERLVLVLIHIDGLEARDGRVRDLEERALRAVGDRLLDVMRADDLVGRIGDTRFVLAMRGVSLSQARDLAEDLVEITRRAVEEVEEAGRSFTVTAAVVEADSGTTPSGLIDAAVADLTRAGHATVASRV